MIACELAPASSPHARRIARFLIVVSQSQTEQGAIENADWPHEITHRKSLAHMLQCMLAEVQSPVCKVTVVLRTSRVCASTHRVLRVDLEDPAPDMASGDAPIKTEFRRKLGPKIAVEAVTGSGSAEKAAAATVRSPAAAGGEADVGHSNGDKRGWDQQPVKKSRKQSKKASNLIRIDVLAAPHEGCPQLQIPLPR